MIKKIDNIILVGTSHVAKQSVKEIKTAIDMYNPEVIGIELDIDRLKSLISENKNANKKRRSSLKLAKEIGVSGYMFAIIAGFVQDKVGKHLGIEAGIDMKTAYIEARKEKIPVSLIDINIRTTLKKLSRIKFSRKISMFSKLFFKSFKKEYRDKLQFDVKKGVPDEKVISNMLKIVKKEIPDMYKILIDDRNKFMSSKLLKLRENHEGNILAVIGAGHLEGMEEYLQKELMNKSGTNSIQFGFVLEQ